MRRFLAYGSLLMAIGCLPAEAQRLLPLDSCRALALRNNKQLSISKVKQDVAANLRRSARTKYLPHVSAIGSYQYTSEEVSILNQNQKDILNNIGTSLVQGSGFQSNMQAVADFLPQVSSMLAQMGIPLEQLQEMASQMQQLPQNIQTTLNGVGHEIVNAFRTDTRNIWAGSIMLTQPVFMGGSIVAMNRLADINE